MKKEAGNSKKPLVMAILDGWGMSEHVHGNAIAAADTKHMDYLYKAYPSTLLETSGEQVGLPPGQMGNSEVGHLNMGAGRIVYQDLTRITKAIRDGSFYANPVLKGLFERCRQRHGKALHIMGLLSDGGVHSHQEHIHALVHMAKKEGIGPFYLHVFLDGRDVPPKSAWLYLEKLEKTLREVGVGEIATVMGRYYAMDRDNKWDRVEKAYRAMVAGEGLRASTAKEAVEKAYAVAQNDEFVTPVVLCREGKPIGSIRPGDGVLFFNYRSDRARELTRSFVDEAFPHFERPGGKLDVDFVCMTEYDETIKAPIAFPPETLQNTLGEVLAAHGLRQLRIAETEKYAHVTFFFNGGVENKNPGEDRLLIPSSNVATHDLDPRMQACKITKTVIDRLKEDRYDVIIINYANADMIGHTGNFAAAVTAIEALDACVKQLVEAVLQEKGVLLITSDHGNAEEMLTTQGSMLTAHTANKVPFIAVGLEQLKGLAANGSLRDVAPTILDILGIEKPVEMTGTSLLI